MDEIVGPSSPYFIINTTSLATQAFALNRSNKNPFLTQSLAKKHYMIIFSSIKNQEHFNLLAFSELDSLTPKNLSPNLRIGAFTAPYPLHESCK